MVWICNECEKGRHKNCENSVSCDCQCNVNGASDVTQKVLATVGGIGMAAGGLALTILSGGWLIPIGGAMMGAGISSTYQGVEKTIKKERINGVGYCADVAFGAATGVLTGGIGAAGETVAAKVVQQGAKEVAKAGVKKLAVRTATGAVAGIASKVVDETKECMTTDKKWSQFGQTLDENGEVSGAGTFVSWTASTVVGGLGGVGGHISSNATKQVTSNLAQSAIRVGVSGTTAAVGDAAVQTTNIAMGKQKEFDIKRTVKSAAVSSITTAAFEGAQGGIYKLNGGKEQVLLDKANKKMIEDKVPKAEQKEVLDSYEKLKKISPAKVDAEVKKPVMRGHLSKQKQIQQARMDNLENQIQQASASLRDVAATNPADRASIQNYAQQRDRLLVQRRHLHEKLKKIDTHISNQKMSVLNDQNAHVLSRDKSQQIATDINPPSATQRGLKRAVFDFGVNRDRNRLECKFAGYTNDHNYGNTPNSGQSDYNQYHGRQIDRLGQIQQGNNLMINEFCNDNEDDEESKLKKA